jgi:hypothetical protein
VQLIASAVASLPRSAVQLAVAEPLSGGTTCPAPAVKATVSTVRGSTCPRIAPAGRPAVPTSTCRFPASRSATSAGVIPLQAVITGLAGLPRSNATAPFAPGAPRRIAMAAGSDTSCVQTIASVLPAALKRPMQPPRSTVATGGTTWSPER